MTSKLQAKHDLLHDAIQKGTSAGKSPVLKPPATLKITRYYFKVHEVLNAALVASVQTEPSDMTFVRRSRAFLWFLTSL